MNRVYNDHHIPVLLNEVVENLIWKPDGVYVDCTVGEGGHTRAIAERVLPYGGRVIGIDVDSEVLQIAEHNLLSYPNVQLFKFSYVELPVLLSLLQVHKVDGLLVDLGVSTYQLKAEGRGFSFNQDEPLDMRMNLENNLTAYHIVNTYPEEKLADIIYNYGEENFSRRIARAIVQNRPIQTTRQLVEVIKRALPYKEVHNRKRHFATKTFQAIRIEVNKEIENISKFLEFAPDYLNSGGRLAIISFHSLEDRIVKHVFKNDKRLKPIGDFISPTTFEVAENPRARSAKLRLAERV
ncbi:16S rRNA (cytosine(1402)-N(4))-methyltransferase RsmH [Fervidobacterium nodosum]|uniref:Ribosomal RNA small subunit methyltransferase H n=1 Tax=Fervidobacterium nodosum (strain ATCC 35602 / DSM 5306 / Rt17-B1) TaxID=381764 RepID=RSMH_FERNB|nr:16S rRNA (cytosine(1402)-N(4))-methyltransferase RsmH [Fervidobacterium nodosum]A7HNY7.1 RecName: Full=Ribosomal RNA small subunit methyltransferase H; AltName: Full=16S rRNA m(4)C1402 methyltransferase; AltName: Full=rRNA (cytosine-N(4)-)-methyltransferase RsmH [Fervidobacterium nodosum Rt17-B1]ABS61620.1 S-adenosyl-methyltransferase MraW [Fervidobacterium nodosum Rt17-B1]PHJ14237.1 16S rRNA methyltransferase [Fervidobacterium sp. SC_NGM5_G05]